MSKIELPPVPEQIRAFAEGSDLEAVEQYARQIVEVCAALCEREFANPAWDSHYRDASQACARAIRNLIEESNNG
jgi:hypothetical protein